MHSHAQQPAEAKAQTPRPHHRPIQRPSTSTPSACGGRETPQAPQRGGNRVCEASCYKRYTRIFKTDTEMTLYRQCTGVLKIDTEMKCSKRTRGFSKSIQKWTLVLYKIVHSSRDRHSQSGYRVISRQELLYIQMYVYLWTRSSRDIKGEIKIDD
jgi:hypothetical protein